MNAHLLPHTLRPLAASPKNRNRFLRVAGCSALFMAAFTAAPTPALAFDPFAEAPKASAVSAKSGPKKEATKPRTKTDTTNAGAKSEAPKSKAKADTTKAGSKSEASKSKAKADTNKGVTKADATSSKTKTGAKTDSGKRKWQWQCTSDGRGTKGAPTTATVKDQPQPAKLPGTFEKGPGVLSVSLRGQRQEQIGKYVSEPVGSVAVAMDGLRFATVNKGTHAEVNLGDRVSVEGKGDKAILKGQRALDVVARILYDNPQTRATIIVHTDDRGEANDNLLQSQQGAEAIKAYLTTRCITADRLTAIGRGEEEPLVTAPDQVMTWKERIRNKRVMLVIEPLVPAPATAALPVAGHSLADTQLPPGIPQPAPGPGVTR